uniref:Protein kinase domain-containing protein n=1 Tax=Heterosigma akashiwo TaxID=2829 RepID=A0A6V1S4W8_HETAK
MFSKKKRGSSKVGGVRRQFITVDHNSDLDHPFSAWCDEVATRDTVRQCLALICEVLTFDIAEMWVKEAGIIRCCQVYSQPPIAAQYEDHLIQEAKSSQTHMLSPALCERADGSKSEPLWFTSTREGAWLHPKLPVQTAVVMQEQVQTCKYMSFYVVCFSMKRMQFDPPILAFLRHMVKACCITASKDFDPIIIQEHDEVQEITCINDVRVLLHKDKEVDTDLSWALLDDARFLANGGFCTIYTAQFKHLPVVVKMLKDDRLDMEAARADLEAEMHFLLRLRHPNVVEIYGAGFNPERFIVLERLDGGTLTEVGGGASHGIGPMKKRKPFSYLETLQYARQFAAALRYLHEDAIPGYVTIHRDLKPGNIGFKLLPNGGMVLKLMDFGLAKSVPRGEAAGQTYQLSGDTGSVRYMAPEVMQSIPYNEKCDIYGFSIILWQMATLRKPFEGMEVAEFRDRVTLARQRPPMHKKWPPDFCALVEDGWQHKFNERPSAAEMIRRLDDMIADNPTLRGSKSGAGRRRGWSSSDIAVPSGGGGGSPAMTASRGLNSDPVSRQASPAAGAPAPPSAAAGGHSNAHSTNNDGHVAAMAKEEDDVNDPAYRFRAKAEKEENIRRGMGIGHWFG